MTYLFTSVICIGQNQINNAIGTNPILTNPAFAGTFSRNLLHLNVKKTWNKLYQGPSVAYQTHINKINSGLGVQYGYFSLGASKFHSSLISYAYQFAINDQLYLSSGISAQLDFNKNNYFEGTCNSCNENNYSKLLNTGFILYHDRFFISLGGHEFRNFSTPFQLKIIYGHKFRIDDVELIPNLLFARQGLNNTVAIRLNLNYNKIKVLLGIGQNSTIGFGLIFKKFDIHYQLNYIGNDLNNISEINNYYSEFNIQMAFPKQINRKTTSFDFGLF